VGLTNEEGAMVKVVSATEIEGLRNVGSFCYNSPEDAYPVYLWLSFLNRQIHLEFGKTCKTRRS
jgi:hypothetical protein